MSSDFKATFRKSTAGDRRSALLFASLTLATLVPAVGVLWFMSVAMRNERLAVQSRANVGGNRRRRAIRRAWSRREPAVFQSGENLRGDE